MIAETVLYVGEPIRKPEYVRMLMDNVVAKLPPDDFDLLAYLEYFSDIISVFSEMVSPYAQKIWRLCFDTLVRYFVDVSGNV